MQTPQQIAEHIVDDFSWSSNVMRDGRLIGQQHVVADAIAEAIKKDRADTNAVLRDALSTLRMADRSNAWKQERDRCISRLETFLHL